MVQFLMGKLSMLDPQLSMVVWRASCHIVYLSYMTIFVLNTYSVLSIKIITEYKAGFG